MHQIRPCDASPIPGLSVSGASRFNFYFFRRMPTTDAQVLLDWSQKASGPIAARGNVNVPKPATAPVTPVHGRANASVGTSASVAAVTPTARRRASATAAVASSTPANSSGETGLPMAPPPPPAVAPRTPTADTLPPAILPPPGSSTSLEASSVAVAPVLGEDDGIPEPDAGGEADADADAAGTQRPVSLPTSTMVTTPHCGPDAAGGGEGVQDAQGAMRPRSEQQQQQQQQHHEQSFVAAAAEAAATAASTTVENLAAVAMVGAAASDHAADMISAVMTTNAGEEAAGGPMPPLSPTAAAAAAAALIESAPGGMAGMFDDDIRDDGGDGGVTVGGVPVTQASPLSKAELEEREAANAALRKAAEEAVDRRGPRDDRRHDRPGLLGELVRPQSAGAGYGGTGWDTALEPCEEEEYKSEAVRKFRRQWRLKLVDVFLSYGQGYRCDELVVWPLEAVHFKLLGQGALRSNTSLLVSLVLKACS